MLPSITTWRSWSTKQISPAGTSQRRYESKKSEVTSERSNKNRLRLERKRTSRATHYRSLFKALCQGVASVIRTGLSHNCQPAPADVILAGQLKQKGADFAFDRSNMVPAISRSGSMRLALGVLLHKKGRTTRLPQHATADEFVRLHYSRKRGS